MSNHSVPVIKFLWGLPSFLLILILILLLPPVFSYTDKNLWSKTTILVLKLRILIEYFLIIKELMTTIQILPYFYKRYKEFLYFSEIRIGIKMIKKVLSVTIFFFSKQLKFVYFNFDMILGAGFSFQCTLFSSFCTSCLLLLLLSSCVPVHPVYPVCLYP